MKSDITTTLGREFSHGRGVRLAAKRKAQEGVHFLIVQEGKPRAFIQLISLQDRGGLLCPEVGVGTAYCDRQAEVRESLLGLVQLHLSGSGLDEYLARCGVPLYPIPEFVQLDEGYTVALAESVPWRGLLALLVADGWEKEPGPSGGNVEIKRRERR